MTDDSAPRSRNEAYLTAALALLRHRLNAALPPAPAAAAAATQHATRSQPKQYNQWFGGLFGGRNDTEETPPPVLLPSPEPAATIVEEKRLRDALEEAGQGEPPPAVVALSRTFKLTPFEHDLLLLCIASELDPILSRQLGPSGKPTFAIAMSVLPDPSWNAMSPDSALRHWNLIEVDRTADRPLTTSPLSIDERILNYCKGVEHVDVRLAPMLKPISAIEGVPTSQRAIVDVVSAAIEQRQVTLLRGPSRSGKEDVAAWASVAKGMSIARLSADALPAEPAEIDILARLWHRETLIKGNALLVDAHELDRRDSDDLSRRLSRFVGRTGGGMVIAARDGLELPLTPAVDRLIGRPTSAEQLSCWMEQLGGGAEALVARRMVTRFDFDRATIAAVTRVAQSGDPRKPLRDRLQEAALTRTHASLGRLAERVEVKATFEDIVLPETQTEQLKQIVQQLEHRIVVLEEWGFLEKMNRGLGVSALFAGDSGTGKTMAAEVVASALGLALYRVDLSAVVSKYIGETEKNLARLFDAADLGGAVLLFDEADALFGKRSEVKDAHDRFANIEIDYLLQRVESYRGVAILTTNMKSALDSAFMRRLRFIVDFPYPGPSQRHSIWQRALPRNVPATNINFEHLAQLDLSGAGIQSVALHAAFLAAARGARLTTELLLEAATSEFRKFNRPINDADFRLDPKRDAA